MWTHFLDMHSGGGQKEPQAHIYIEAPEEEAKVIFYNRFGHNPERMTCTCCGEDYSISSKDDLAQLTGFHRGCNALETPRDPKTGLYRNDDSEVVRKYYYEQGEEPPPGYTFSSLGSLSSDYKTLDEYLASEDVLVIRAADIKPEERKGDIPAQGYVWVD